MRGSCLASFIVAVGLIAPAAVANVTCTKTSGTGSCSVSGSGPYTVNITAQSSDAAFTVAGSTSDRITVINVTTTNGSSLNRATIAIGSDSGYIGYLDEINMVNTLQPCIVDQLRIEHDVGSLEVTQLNDGIIKGDVTGDITLVFATNATFKAQPRIHDVRVDGSFYGDISGNHDGTIDGVDLGLTIHHSLGTALAHSQINISHNIEKLAAGDIYADINTLSRASNDLWAGYIATLETDTQWGGSGGLHGTITTTRCAPTTNNTSPIIRIRGDFDCDMELVGHTVVGGAHAGTYHGLLQVPIKVDHDFTSGAVLPMESDGLKAQVVFNDDNNSSTWDGDVIVGATTLSTTPSYSQTAASLGRGSVGLVKFDLHGTSCEPTDGATVGVVYPDSCPTSYLLCDPEAPNDVENATSWAAMRMYGPVVFNLSGGDTPCTIERRAIGSTGGWSNVTSDYRFDIYTSGDGMGTADAGERVLRVRRVSESCLQYFPVGYDYRVKPVSGKLKCKGVDGGDTVNVASFEYNFSLPYDCGESLMARFDLNTDHSLNSGDIATWLISPRDVNDDGAVNVVDPVTIMQAINENGG